MNKLEDLKKRMDRIKELMDATGMSMEQLLAQSAITYVYCRKCPINSVCKQYIDHEKEIGCVEVWTMYLKGELNKNT